jgi:hypothetical protein
MKRYAWRGSILGASLTAGAAAFAFAAHAAPLGPEPQARCSYTPRNGEVLQNNTTRPQYGHSVEIDNGTAGDAIIKVRDAASSSLRVSFFVGRNQKAVFEDLPDGAYIIQYAFGDALAQDCKSFITVFSADRFPGIETFKTTYIGNEVETDILGYTLYATPSGNVIPKTISAAEFNQD